MVAVTPAGPGGSPGSPQGAVRAAVRAGLADLPPGAVVLVACSGGADSLALAAATAAVRPGSGAVVVDHGLQDGSAAVAQLAASQCAGLGLAPVDVVSVQVAAGPGSGGPEAAARAARHQALISAAQRHGAAAVLLAHSRDDQAETVLLGLARGSGARSLAGMAPVAGLLRRPLLGLPRSVLRAAVQAAGLQPWDDPHNADARYARVRVRDRALPVLTAELGPAVVAALARSADLLRADADALDDWAAEVAGRALVAGRARVAAPPAASRADTVGVVLDCAVLAAVPVAVRSRVLLAAAREAGAPAGALTAGHVGRLDALVVAWRGQGPVALPGAVCASRACGRLTLRRQPQPD
ncbi:MAG: tRNA lysidine(34) synthetase TilS [Actinomycetota bacterium]|nr:MAG: tRNA lysidine(34) synthetase TilS [Actinomycetota bacterium]